MANPAKAVIFDQSTVFLDSPEAVGEVRTLLCQLADLNVRRLVFSNNSIPNFAQRAEQRGYPPFEMLVTRADVGIPKGSPRWVEYASNRMGLPAHHFFSVGDDNHDWQTAINSGVLYAHAGWSRACPAGVTTVVRPRPADLFRFLTHFFFHPDRWQYSLDLPQHGLCVRSLLNATGCLPANDGTGSFTLQDVFTYENRRMIGPCHARTVLMFHAIANLYAEGLLPTGCYFAVYPSSTPGHRDEAMAEFLTAAAKFFHGWLKEDLLVRGRQAVDSSRARSRREHVGFTNQSNTVLVSPDYRGKLGGRTVVVFDDFTTSGMSLDWARTLLLAAGAERVVLMTFGKYGQNHPVRHSLYSPLGVVDPFGLFDYTDGHFNCTQHDMECSEPGRDITREMFRYQCRMEPYPTDPFPAD